MAQAFLNCWEYNQNVSEVALIIDRSISELVVPDGVTAVGNYSFSYCTKLKKISIPEGVKSIGANALNATSLTEVVLPLSCEAVNSYSFYNIATLKSITFGDIKTIGSHALGANYGCKTYDFTRCTTVPKLTNVEAFANINPAAKIYVPVALYDEWVSSTNWTNLAEYIIPIYDAPEIVTPNYVSEGLLVENKALTGRGTCTDSVIVVPEEVTRIDTGAFENDSIIDTLILPESGCYFEPKCFDHSSLRVIKNFDYIGISFALCNATNLKIVTFIDGASLENFGFGYSNATIEIYDFSKCKSIVVLPQIDYITVSEGTKILVPVELYSEWKVDTNWSVYADCIFCAK